MRIKCFVSMLILVTFFSGAFFVPNSFADSKERDEIIKFIKQKKARWSARDTKISHFTRAERKKRLGSQIPTQITQERILVTTSAAVPSQLDWRNYNGNSYVTPVKEQSDCSDCWAFASTAALESNKLISNNTPGVFLDLSEQTLNSCSGAGSCSGGYIDAAANFLRDIGLPLESCNPYTATDGMCSVSCSDWLINPYKISGWYKVNPAIEAIKYALYNYGPVVALMSVYTDFYYYSTGVYEKSWGSFEGYHAVLIVGYDDVEQYFIIKSSWGEDWGEAGYGKIAYGEVSGDAQFGFWTIAYENAIPTGFPTQDNIPRDPNNPNTSNPNENENSSTQFSILNGTIRNESGNAVSSAEIRIGKYKVTSNTSGIYVFSSLPAGTYVATVSKSGYATLSENLTITANDTVTKDFVISLSSQTDDNGKKLNDDSSQDKKDNPKKNNAGINGPGWFDVKGKLVSIATAEKYFKARREKILAANSGNAPLAGVAADTSSPELIALARGLRYDPKLIYDYVHNNIDYIPNYGSHKGALLTYLDGSGNDFDQASLMIALLRISSGYNSSIGSVRYVYGNMTIPGGQMATGGTMANWLGVDPTQSAIEPVVASGGIPADDVQTDGTVVNMVRIWVQATINGNAYQFDPALKSYNYVSKIDIGTAMSYNRNAFLSSAVDGNTDIQPDYVKKLNDENLRSQLADYATNLVNFIKTQQDQNQNYYINYDVKQIIGGRTIKQDNLTSYQSTVQYAIAGWTVVTNENYFLSSLSATMQIQHAGINYTFKTHDLAGKRLTITYNTSNYAELRLDGALPSVVGGTTTGTVQTTTGNPYDMTITINHPYPYDDGDGDGGNDLADQAVTYTLVSGSSYAIVYNFGGNSDKLLQQRQQQLEIYKAPNGCGLQACDETSEQVRGETLNIMGQTYLKEFIMARSLISALTETVPVNHHIVGVMAQEAGYYIDAKVITMSTHSMHNITADERANQKTTTLIGSALEHGMLAQLMGVRGASTMSLFQIANNTGVKIFGVTNADYFINTIWPQLTGYSSTGTNNDYSTFLNYLNAGFTLILPANGQLASAGWNWKGKGYIPKYISDTKFSTGAIIGGDYYGGICPYTSCTVNSKIVNSETDFSNLTTINVDNAYLNWRRNMPTNIGDPVDSASGAFLYDSTDLALGGSSPLGLSFARTYNSNRNFVKNTLGYGFSHNYDITLNPGSHGGPVFGERQPIDAASMIAAIYACLDILKTYDTTQAWVTASLASNWAVDQGIDNAITVNLGGKVMEYIKLPDGTTYAPPPGITTRLIKNSDNTFRLQERSGAKINFNAIEQINDISIGKISQIVDADGNTANFTYKDTDKKLDKVTDAFGRYIQLTYTGDKITSVSDFAPGSTTPMRTVSYSYDTTNNNLTGYTDAEGQPWVYVYGTPANHRITSLKNPLLITTITNFYNNQGQVETQRAPRQGGGTADYNYYFSGFRNQAVDPDGHATTYYFDKKGREYAQEDALGNKVTKTFDGQDHVVSVTDPRSTTENPIITNYEYDGNNNLKKVTNAYGYFVKNTYDTQFRLTDTTDNNNQAHNVHYNYDTNHPYSISDITDAVGNKTYNTYYSASEFPKGFIKTTKDPRGTITTLTYDSYGNPQSAQTTGTAVHPAVTYTYDIIGRMTDLYDQENQDPLTRKSTHFEYDKRGLLKLKKDMLDKTSTYIYYDNGLLHTKTDRKGQTITYTYTPMDKIDTITYSDPNATPVKFYYNNLDQMTRMDDAIDSDPNTPYPNYIYDDAGRLISMTDSNGNTIGYDYDAAGNLTSLTYPGNKVVTYTYDKLNRLNTVNINWLPNQTATYQTTDYDATGRLRKFTNFNGTITTYDYDNASRLKAINNLKSDGVSVIAGYAFTVLDGNGNRTEIVQTEPYAPAASASANIDYTYNATKNRMTAVAGVSYGYDNEGQLASINNGAPYTFDYEHRLKKIGTDTEFFYDGGGNRLKAVRPSGETHYIYDATGRLLAEADENNIITRYYIYGKGLLATVTPDGRIYCYHYNGVGSTVAMTNSDQAVVNQYSYDAFGNIANQQETISQPFKYVGQAGVMTEPNGFYYMKARYYDPTVGRFISEDPSGFGGGDVNLMAYVGNNPVTGIDPSGLCGESSFISKAWDKWSDLVTMDSLLDMYFDIRQIRDDARNLYPAPEQDSFMRHYTASYNVTTKYGPLVTRIFGTANEVYGFFAYDIEDIWGRISGKRRWAFSLDDFRANEKGISDAVNKR